MALRKSLISTAGSLQLLSGVVRSDVDGDSTQHFPIAIPGALEFDSNRLCGLPRVFDTTRLRCSALAIMPDNWALKVIRNASSSSVKIRWVLC